jgi:transcriptional regulator with XRE-family HTH domain
MNNEVDIVKIGNKIRELRKKAGYTSYENFAFDNDLSPRYYWSVEKGRNMRLEYFLKILNIFKISPQDFFKDIK